MSPKNALKLFTVAASAALTGSYMLWRKLAASSSQAACPKCQREGGLTLLVDARGRELAISCAHCHARHEWDADHKTLTEITSPGRWQELLNSAHP